MFKLLLYLFSVFRWRLTYYSWGRMEKMILCMCCINSVRIIDSPYWLGYIDLTPSGRINIDLLLPDLTLFIEKCCVEKGKCALKGLFFKEMILYISDQSKRKLMSLFLLTVFWCLLSPPFDHVRIIYVTSTIDYLNAKCCMSLICVEVVFSCWRPGQ